MQILISCLHCHRFQVRGSTFHGHRLLPPLRLYTVSLYHFFLMFSLPRNCSVMDAWWYDPAEDDPMDEDTDDTDAVQNLSFMSKHSACILGGLPRSRYGIHLACAILSTHHCGGPSTSPLQLRGPRFIRGASSNPIFPLRRKSQTEHKCDYHGLCGSCVRP